MTSTLPKPHHSILDSVLRTAQSDDRLTAVLAGGSLLHGGFDEHSDLDLIIVCAAEAYDTVMQSRRAFAESCGDLLAAFTGEHVGEPRLLICLYGPAVIHVDLKFVTGSAFDHLIERPMVLWTRDDRLEATLDAAPVQWPNQTPQWFEERFWIWVHYAATKLGRGEFYEAIGMLAFLREQVLGPLIHQAAGRPQRGVRRLEASSPEHARALEQTLAEHTRDSVLQALQATIALYMSLSSDLVEHSEARSAVTGFVAQL